MQFLVKVTFVCLLAYVAFVVAAEEEGRATKTRVTESQLNMALNDDRYFRRQLKCALGEATCDPVGRRLRSLVPLVMRGSCPQCSQEEELQIKKVISHIQRKFPKEWSKLVRQYTG